MKIKFVTEVSGIVVMPENNATCAVWVEGEYSPFKYAETENGVPTECDTPETWDISSVYFDNGTQTPFNFNMVNDVAFFERETLDEAREIYERLNSFKRRRALSDDF